MELNGTAWDTPDGHVSRVEFDATVPNVARIYDYLLGGKDHFRADRDAAEELRKVLPDVAVACRQNREFLRRAVRYLAREEGISQFILYTQRAAASGRLGRATQDTYYRHTGGSRHITVQRCLGCMLAPPVWLAGLVSRHIRSARRLREQRQRAEPVPVTEPGAWAKATGEQ